MQNPCHCETSDRCHWLWQSVPLWLCARVLRMTLLRCPKFLRCLTADAENFDRGHSLTSLPLPPAALGSLPTSPRVRYKGRGRTGGEIGEAPPVADAARRFRGSAPIGGHNGGRESVGTTVGKRTPPLRRVTGGAMGGRPQGSPLRSAARNVWAGYRPRRKFFDREGMVCFGFWWRRMTRAPGC